MKAMNTFLAIMSALAIFSCSGKEDTLPKEETVSLSVSQKSFSIEATATSVTLTVTSSKAPSVVSQDSWLSRTIGTFSSDKTSVEIKAEENTSSDERTGSLKVICGEENVVVSVTQKGKETAITDPCPDVKPIDNDAYALAKKLGMGWNLGNQMDAYSNGVSNETCWGNAKATQATFDGVKAKGFTSVRIPITWLGHIGAAPDYKIDETWMNRVAEIVGYAEKAGLYAVINIHHDGSDSKYWLDIVSASKDAAKQTAVIEEIKAVWGQIAERFKSKGAFLIFESFNEIQDGKWGWGTNLTDGGKQYKCLNEWNQAFVDKVRASGGENASRYLIVPGYCTNPTLTIETLKLPDDSAKGKLIVSVHCYDPSSYTLEEEFSEWGHSGTAGKKPDSGESDIISLYSRLRDKFTANNIPVIIGETGCGNRATARELLFRNYYLEFTYKAAKAYGLVPFIWDNGSTGTGKESNGFINHGTGEYIINGKAAVQAMKKATFTEDDNYTLSSIYNAAP